MICKGLNNEKGNIGKKLNVVDKNYKDRGYFTQKGTTGGYQEPGKKSLNKAAGQKYKSHSLIDKHKGKVLDHNPVRSLYVILFSNQNNAFLMIRNFELMFWQELKKRIFAAEFVVL